VYERCRRFLGEELGAYPSPETEAVYLELLRSSPTSALVDAGHLEADDVLGVGSRPRRHRRLAVAGAGVVLVCAAAAAIAMTRGNPPPPEVLPTSLVRLDPKTLEPTKVVRIGPRADFVVVAGGYVWFTQGILRYGAGGIRNAGDRALTRVDPATGKATPVAGGVAPCGITPDPSGDMWVLNCYASGQSTNVQRINHRTLEFEPTYKIADGGFVRGMTYGGGWLWLNGKEDAARVIKLNPRTGRPRTIALPNPASGLAWSGSYGDLWIGDFGDNGVRGSVSRMPVETERAIKYPYYLGDGPAALLVQGDSVWVADWNNPFVVRVPAFGSGPPRYYRLKVRAVPAGVTALAAGFGAVWATVPDDRAVWRIDEETGERTRIPLRYYPWGVAAADDGIWVSLRARDA
jgi:streptogramin lyase